MLYDWLKALHLIAVICWMAGLFYLPRLFVYHASAKIGSETSETFKVMERKLLFVIMNPSMGATFVFGVWLFYENPDLLFMPYMWGKMGMVALLTLYHFYLLKVQRLFAADRNEKSHRFYRFLNEIPSLLLVGIVILVIVKPFF